MINDERKTKAQELNKKASDILEKVRLQKRRIEYKNVKQFKEQLKEVEEKLIRDQKKDD